MATSLEEALPISVVIPAFNRPQYVAEAVGSVIAQTRRAAEVIVVDDGSRDEATADAARAAGAMVIRQENRGLPAARNTGISAAKSSWVAFLDDDDLWVPHKLERQWSLVAACPQLGFVFTDHSAFSDEKVVLPSLYAAHPQKWDAVGRQSVGPRLSICNTESAVSSFFRWNFVNMSSLLVKRDLLFRVGLFDESLSGWEDREITLRLFAAAQAGVVEEPLVRRRRHAEQLTENKIRLKFDAAAATTRILERPWLYPKGTANFYRREPARWLLEAGELLLRSGMYAEAKKPLGRSLRLRFSIRTAKRYFQAWRQCKEAMRRRESRTS